MVKKGAKMTLLFLRARVRKGRPFVDVHAVQIAAKNSFQKENLDFRTENSTLPVERCWAPGSTVRTRARSGFDIGGWYDLGANE